MDHHTRARLYAHVYVLFWPWLWWQLLRLGHWLDLTGRKAMISVDVWGNVYCTYISDAPEAADTSWHPQPARHSPWNLFPTGCATLARLGAGLTYDPTRTGDQVMLAAWLLSNCPRAQTSGLWPRAQSSLGRLLDGRAILAPP